MGVPAAWAEGDDKGLAAKMINARSETVGEKPAFRDSWARGRRCLIPAHGFYEWYEKDGVNQPWFIHRNGTLLAIAGLWTRQKDLVTFTILTREAESPIRDMHHRMPVILDPADAAGWFSAATDEAARMIQRSVCADLSFHRVGATVGKVANDTADLMNPVTDTACRASQGLLV